MTQRLYPLIIDHEGLCGYDVLEQLGSGQYGEVFKVQRDGTVYAVKKELFEGAPSASILMEAAILAQAKHRHIINAIDMFFNCDEFIHPDMKGFHIVLEYADGGNLADFLGTNPSFQLKLKALYEIFAGFKFLHSR